jgi:hypothetical protein
MDLLQKKKKELSYHTAIPILGIFLKESKFAGHWYLIPVILATREAEIRRIAV